MELLALNLKKVLFSNYLQTGDHETQSSILNFINQIILFAILSNEKVEKLTEDQRNMIDNDIRVLADTL